MTNENKKIGKMLVVDDTQENLESAKKAFQDKYDTDFFSNYSKAVDALNQNKYDVVLTDLLMPKEGDLEKRTKDFINDISEPRLKIPNFLDIGLNKVSEKDIEKIIEYNRYCTEFYKPLSNKGIYGEFLDLDKLPERISDEGEILDIIGTNKEIDKKEIFNKIMKLSNKCSKIWGEKNWGAKLELEDSIKEEIENFNDSILVQGCNCAYKSDSGEVKKGILKDIGGEGIGDLIKIYRPRLSSDLIKIYMPRFNSSSITSLRDSNILNDNLIPAGYFISENCAEKQIPVGILSHMGKHATHAYLIDYFLSGNSDKTFDDDTATYNPKKDRLFRVCNDKIGKTPQEWDYTLAKLIERSPKFKEDTIK
ncbi:MAG: response regulator [Nanobdellota archaeon]